MVIATLVTALVLGVPVSCGPDNAPPPTTYYLPTANRIVLQQTACDAINAHRRDFLGYISVYLLAHEEGHAHDPLVGSRTDCNRRGRCEGYADCWGAAHYVLVARAVGYRAVDARRMRAQARTLLVRPGATSYGAIPKRCWR